MRMLALCIAAAALAMPADAADTKGTPRLHVYFMKGFEDASWQQASFAKVARGWKASTPPALGAKAVVISTITRDGKLLEARIGTSSGSEAWDQGALAAVRQASPYPPLPKSWPETSLEVHWHFEYAK